MTGDPFLIGVPGAAVRMPNSSNDGLWLMPSNHKVNSEAFTTILLG
jgi:hypothetical protein